MPSHRWAAMGRRASTLIPVRLRAIPATVWLITALWGALLLGASLLWPMTYGYDEPQHIDMAYHYSARPFDFSGPGQLEMAQGTSNMFRYAPGYPPRTRLDLASIPLRGDRPSFADLGGHEPTVGTQPNQMIQHPPLYYWAAAVVLRLPGVSHLAWDLQVWLMRLLSVLFMLPVPILCWAAAEVFLTRINPLRPARQLAALAAVVPLTIPNMIRVGSSVSNDSLLILTTSVVLYGATRVVTGDLSRRTSIWLGAALAAALWTKGFALVLPPVVLLAYLVGAWGSGGPDRRRFRVPWAALVGPAVGTAVGSVWWVRNLVDYGTVQIDGLGPVWQQKLNGPPDHHGTLVTFLPTFTNQFIARIWAGIGLPDLPTPGPLVAFGWFLVVALGIVTALFLRGAERSRLRSITIFSVSLFTIAVVMYGSYDAFRKWSQFPRATQGRYLYHLVVAMGALAAVGWLHLVQPRLRPMLVPVTVLVAVITNLLVWVLIVRSWYSPNAVSVLSSLNMGGHGILRWSPTPIPITLFFVGVLPVVATVVALIGTYRQARRLQADQITDEPMPALSLEADGAAL